MKNPKMRIFPLILIALLSCTSVPKEKAEIETLPDLPMALLPMREGWYQCDSQRLFKGLEDEYMYAQNFGMEMKSEITFKYEGVVCRFEEGVLFDPVSEIELSIDSQGLISCRENISIDGKLDDNGRFFWSGLKEEHGRLNSIFVTGTLVPLPSSARAGREYNGVYHMVDTGTGREQLVNISDGFYTWHYLDDEDAGFTPWPTLLKGDGTFSIGFEITTVMAMGEFHSANFSSTVIIEGRVTPGQGIRVEEISRSTGIGQDEGGAPNILAGTMIRSGEYPNEAIPKDIESLVRAGRATVRAEPKPNPANYPAWYLKRPVKAGFIYAIGEKTFADKETAFAMAEAAAAANIAEQFWVQIESELILNSVNNQTTVDERIKSETLQRLDYRIIERAYNDATQTAFVLAEAETGNTVKPGVPY